MSTGNQNPRTSGRGAVKTCSNVDKAAKEPLAVEKVILAELTDKQCDAIYDALDSFGRGVDNYSYGLPIFERNGGGDAKVIARELIREAVART